MARRWVGTYEIALRLPSVLGAVVSVALLYGLARRMFNERVAFVSALLLAVHPLVVQWSQQARGYTGIVALVIGVTWLFLRALECDTAGAWALYGVTLAVLILWHTFSALIFLPVHVLVAWRRPRAVAPWEVVVVALLPWFWVFVNRPPDELPTRWIPELTPQYAGRTLLEVSGAMGVGLALALVGAYLVRQHRRLLVGWAFLPFVAAAAASILDSSFLRLSDRLVPAFAILGGVAIVQSASRVRVAAVTAAAVGTLVGLILWYGHDGSQNWQGEDWKAATAYVMREGGAQVVYGRAAHVAYTYYGGQFANTGLVVQRRPWGGFSDDEHVIARFGAKLRVIRAQYIHASPDNPRVSLDRLLTSLRPGGRDFEPRCGLDAGARTRGAADAASDRQPRER